METKDINCVLLTTDTKHHRYFANRISELAGITIILETKNKSIPWGLSSIITGYYKQLENQFEDRFFKDMIQKDFRNTRGIYKFENVNEQPCVDLIKKIKPDLLISFGTGKLKSGILEINTTKINIHRGILPEYRGLDSDLWAAYFNDFKNIGTTIHTIEERLDTGAIIAQERVKLSPAMKVYHMRYYTTLLATEMVQGIIQKLKASEPVTGTPQDLTNSRYYSNIGAIKRIIAGINFSRNKQAVK